MSIQFPFAAACLCAVSAAAAPALTGETSRPDNSWFVLGEKVDISLAAEGLAPGERLPLDIGVFDEEVFYRGGGAGFGFSVERGEAF